MKVLLTNDDGYNAEGILVLAHEIASRGNEVTIVAPERQRSAASHAVTLHKPLRLIRVTELEKENIRVFYTNGTPADSAMIGLLEAAPDSDICISGINNGPNLGEDVLYSGTVAGAMEGALIGCKSISVSLSEHGWADYELAAKFTAGLAARLVESDLPDKTALNVNVPPLLFSEYKGFRIVPLGSRKYVDVLQKRIDPRGQAYFWITGELIREDTEPYNDNNAIADGYISVTPLVLDFTDYRMLEKCRFDDPMQA